MKTTKRKEFIKFLVDLGFDLGTSDSGIRCFYNNEPLFLVNDYKRFKLEIIGDLEKLDGELPYKIYSEVMKYASLKVEDRFREYEIEIKRIEE